jgi:signal transduction histidine kinase/DNA-binding response OmpR family regulator
MRLLGLLIALLLPLVTSAGERGSPIVQTYNAQLLGAAHISTHLLQLPDGRLWVTNMHGLLRFDGARWLVVRHPKDLGGMEFLSLGPDNRVYTSVDGDIGYFHDDASGYPIWHSLLDQVTIDHTHIRDIRSVAYDQKRRGVWYAAPKHVLFIPDDGGPAAVIGGDELIVFAGLVGDEYWMQQYAGRRLRRVNTSGELRFETIPGAEAMQNHIWTAAPGDGDFKIAAVTGQIYSYRDGQLAPWTEVLVPLLAQSDLRSMVHLRDGRYAIATSTVGLLILDAAGRLVDRYGDVDGLATQLRLLGMVEDRDGDLWLAGDRNITRIALSRAVSVYDETRGLVAAYDAERWNSSLYVAGPIGVYRLVAEQGPGGGRFERILPQLRAAQSLAVVNNTLIIAAGNVHAIRLGADGTPSAQTVATAAPAMLLEASRFTPGRVWVAHTTGIKRLDQRPDGSFVETSVSEIDTAVYKLGEQDGNTLWAADRLDGVMRVTVDGSQLLKRYGVEQGLPPGQVRIYPGAHQVWFTTTLGLRTYDPASDRFIVPAGLPADLHKDRLFSVYEDAERNLWVRGGEIMNDVYWKTDTGWRPDGGLLNTVDPHPTIFNFMREGDVAWAIRATGLLRFDLSNRTPLQAAPQPLLTTVYDLRSKSRVALNELSALGSEVRDLRFEFALPALHRPDAIQYRSRLAGYDSDWSDWAGSEASTRVYTNLPDGRFDLQVEAKDSLWRVVAMPAQAIQVSPPWWRSTAAHAGYGFFALSSLWTAARLGARRRQRQLLVRQRELEAVVDSRTQELKQSNAQLALQAERLSEIDRLKTRFFTNVGHEFRTPLTLVLGPLDDVMRDSRIRLPERARELLELANRNAKRVLDLIVQLLDVNRLEHGQLPLQRERVELIAFLKRQRDDWQPLADRFGHQLDLELPELATLELECDPLQLERALGNLVSNAAKYTPRGGHIRVALSCIEQAVSIVVADNGQGIATEALPHVFDRFFQAQAEHLPQGTGIGLALVREIVEGHGGSIHVDSTPGQGSCFTLTVPRSTAIEAVAPAPLPSSEPREAAQAEARELPVALVIDDHTDLRLRLRRLLEPRFRVVEAGDGPTGLAAARSELPDIIVCDVMMPGFDGVELAKRLRADADIAAVPLLLLTAKTGAEHAVAGLRAGADDYLSKPFDASELLARIDALLAVRRRLQRLAPTASVVATTHVVSDEDKFRARLDAAIKAHVGDSQFGVEELAQALHADRSTLFRRIKELYGQNARDYLREARMKHAFELLGSQAGNVTEVAYAVGFESLSGFSRAFRQRFGVSPSAAYADAGREAC